MKLNFRRIMNYKQSFLTRLNAHIKYVKPSFSDVECKYLDAAVRKIVSEVTYANNFDELSYGLDKLHEDAIRDTGYFKKYLLHDVKKSYLLAFTLSYDILSKEVVYEIQ